MSPRGNSPQVQAGKVPKQRTQNNPTHIDMTKTTTEKEDAQDSTGTRQHANVAAAKEDATDSTAHKAGKEFLTITNTATKEDAADSSANLSALRRRGHQTVKEEASKSITTMTRTCSTTSTEDYYNMKTNKLPTQWRIPDQIGITREDLGLVSVFNFVGEDKEEGKQPRQELGTTLMQAEDQMLQGVYMDAFQDYSSGRRKIVKPSKRWRTNAVKAKKFRPSSNIGQGTSATNNFETTNKGQTRESGIFRFGCLAKETKTTVTSLTPPQEPPRHQNRTEDKENTRRSHKSRPTAIKVRAKSNMPQGPDRKGNPTGKRKGTAPKPRKTNQYERRVKELETEMEMRAQRRIVRWKGRQQKKLQGFTETLDVSAILKKKFQNNTKTGRKKVNTKKSNYRKAKTTPTGTTSTSRENSPSKFRFGSRQQISSAVRFAKFRSNRRYKPGD